MNPRAREQCPIPTCAPMNAHKPRALDPAPSPFQSCLLPAMEKNEKKNREGALPVLCRRREETINRGQQGPLAVRRQVLDLFHSPQELETRLSS